MDESLHESAVLLCDTVLLMLLPEKLVAVLLITVLLCLGNGSPLSLECLVPLNFFEICKEIVLFLFVFLTLRFLESSHRVVPGRTHFPD